MMSALEEVLMDCDEELAMVAKITEAEALEPSSLADARRQPDWSDWEQAIEEELAMIRDAGTWILVEPPAGANIVGLKWVLRAKKDADGNVVRKKARLVTQGFSQVPGVDYFDTFAPVTHLASICTIMALAARNDMEMDQINMKGVYLNSELTPDEVIYMRQPPGYASRKNPQHVCKLLKTLYGLKQSGHQWYQWLFHILVNELGFAQCEVDHAVFYRCSTDSALVIIVVHVDDCTIASSKHELIDELKMRIKEFVEITDMGELHWLLGIEVKRDREARTILLSQRSYINSIVCHFGFEDLKPITTPMDPNAKLSPAQSPSTDAQYAAM